MEKYFINKCRSKSLLLFLNIFALTGIIFGETYNISNGIISDHSDVSVIYSIAWCFNDARTNHPSDPSHTFILTDGTTYIVASPNTLNMPENSTLNGVYGATIILYTGPDNGTWTYLLEMNDGCTLENLIIDGGRGVWDCVNARAIGITVKNCTIRNNCNNPVYPHGRIIYDTTWDSTVSPPIIDSIDANARIYNGFLLDVHYADSVNISYSNFENAGCNPWVITPVPIEENYCRGISARDVDYLTVDRCNISNTAGGGIAVGGGSKNIVITNNTIDSTGQIRYFPGRYIFAGNQDAIIGYGGDSAVSDIYVINNEITNYGNHGIHLSGYNIFVLANKVHNGFCSGVTLQNWRDMSDNGILDWPQSNCYVLWNECAEGEAYKLYPSLYYSTRPVSFDEYYEGDMVSVDIDGERNKLYGEPIYTDAIYFNNFVSPGLVTDAQKQQTLQDLMVYKPSPLVAMIPLNGDPAEGINPFLMSISEITQEDFKEVTGSNVDFYHQSYLYYRLPAENVTFYDAVLYCNARSARENMDAVYLYSGSPDYNSDGQCINLNDLTMDKTKNGYRLPTPEEWGYAYLGGTSPTVNNGYYWTTGSIDDYAYHEDNSGGISHPVRERVSSANGYGLFDMAGNVAEWTWSDLGNESIDIDSKVCGGHWCLFPNSVKFKYHGGDYFICKSGVSNPDFAGKVGFRIVREKYVDTLLEEGFQNGLNSWEFYYNYQNACAMGYTTWDGYPNYVFYGAISADGEETWDVHLRKDGIQLVQGRTYTFQFEAKGIYGRERDIHVVLEDSSDPYTNYSNAQHYFHLTSQMQTFEYTFTMNEPTDMTAGICFEMGECSTNDMDIPNIVIIDNVKIIERY